MKLHRFYVGNELELDRKVWVNNQQLLHQWTNVLRFRPGQEIILFNDLMEERLYRVDVIEPKAIHLVLVTEMAANTPKKEIYLCFSLLKKDNTNVVLQKGTELGIRHFIPLITERTEKTGFDIERSKKIVIEAAEQCGRADIPAIREPITLETALEELKGKCKFYVAEQGSATLKCREDNGPEAVLVGPEGGWSDDEKELFKSNNLEHIDLSKFTLRAETACIAAASMLCSC